MLLAGPTGMLYQVRAAPAGYDLIDQVQAIEGHEIWAPPALAAGRLLIRNMTTLICLDVS